MRNQARFVTTMLLAAAVVLASSAGRALAQPLPDTAPPPPPPDDEPDTGAAPSPGDDEPLPQSAAGPPAQLPNQAAFQQELSPYGRWVQTPDYGRVWIPNGVGPDWRPYTDGRWVDTQWGWSFVSPAPWGAAVYHYGRWGFRVGLGWFWVPGYVWAPAWVSWRYYQGYVCWSPYGPAGYVYPRNWGGWVVVPSRAFTRPVRAYIVPWAQARFVVRSARPALSVVAVPRRGYFYGPPRAFVRRESPSVRATIRVGPERHRR